MPLTPFVEEVLELGVPIGMSGGPAFSTGIDETDGGIETRQPWLEEEEGRWDIGQRDILNDEWAYLKTFFRARRAMAVGFLVKIWTDYQLADEAIGTGDAATVLFQITQTADTGYGEPYVRRITKPKASTLNVYLGGVLQNPSTYTLDATKGQITFDTAPGNGVVVSVTCDFYTPVRFDVDHLPPSLEGVRLSTGEMGLALPPLPIKEISPEEILS